MMFLLDSELFVILSPKQNIFHKNIRNAMLDQTHGPTSPVFCFWKWHQERVQERTQILYFGQKHFWLWLTVRNRICTAIRYSHTHAKNYTYTYICICTCTCICVLSCVCNFYFAFHSIPFLFLTTGPNPLNWFNDPLTGPQLTAWKTLLCMLSGSKDLSPMNLPNTIFWGNEFYK